MTRRPFSPGMPASARFVAGEMELWSLSRPGRRVDDGIRELHLELTHRCNLKCRMCHHWRMGEREKEITLPEIERMLDSSRLLRGIKTAVLTGGEPLLRPDLAVIAAAIAGRYPGISLGILTNLADTKLLLRRLEECAAEGVSGLWLGSSLDGAGAAHDKVRGTAGAYARTMRSAGELRAKYPGMNISFNFTLLPFNAADLAETYFTAKKMKVWLGAQKVVNHSGFEAEKYSWDEKALGEALRQIDLIITDICAENKAFERLMSGKENETPWLWASLIYWVRLREYMVRPRRFMGDCLAGERYAMLSPGGELFFCPVRKHLSVGNVIKDGFDAVWTGTKAAAERKKIAAARCHCWLHCIANPVIDEAMTLRFAPRT